MKTTLKLLLLVGIIMGLAKEAPASDSRADEYNSLRWKTSIKDDWYEWWYYKVIDPKTQKAFYFCYGMVNPWDFHQSKPASKAFVSAGNFSSMKIIEQKWAPQDFRSSPGEIINIGANNSLNMSGLTGDIVNEKGEHVRWNLQTQTDWSFNAMGWTMKYENASGIYWYPAQASLRMSGWIEFDGERIELQNALGYQDRNWGKSFPPWWAWIVSNNFNNSPETIFVSGGGRPKLFNEFAVVDGYTLGLRHQGKVYEFRFPDGDQIQLDIHFGKWHIDAFNKRNERIVVEATAPREKFLMIPFTTPQGPVYKDYEALQGHLNIKLYTREFMFAPWRIQAELDSVEAGIEFGSFDNQLNLNKVFGSSIHLQ